MTPGECLAAVRGPIKPTKDTGVACLYLWDFDDTLAYSESAVSTMMRRFPDVHPPMWWHGEDEAKESAAIAEPMLDRWRKLETLPGRHMILTARNGPSVEHWIHINRETVPATSKIERVISTSVFERRHIPARKKKADEIEKLVDEFPMHVIVLIDDRIENLTEVDNRRIPDVLTFHARRFWP